MDRCSVPGYYYDQEKKKYFRVQPDHVAPPNAKYSASKVKREESRDRDAKRQKLDEELRRVETVTPSRALRTLSGFGLKREIGGRSQASHAAQLDQNLANGLTHVDLSMGRLEIHDVIHVHQTGTYLFAGRLGNDFIEGKHHDTQNAKRDVPKPTTGWNVMGVKTTIDTIRRGSDHYVLSYSNERQALQAVIYPVVTPQDMCKYSRFDIVPDGFYHYLKQVWGFADCPVAEATAFFGTGILNIDTQTAQARELYEPSPTEEIFAACFTQPHILAFGMRKQLGIFEPADHAVFLWDIRQPTHHSSCALRIHRPDKITGLEKLDDSGTTLLITSNHTINTYDLRMLRPDDPPQLTIPHTSGTSHLNFARHDSIVAAEDQYGRTHLYSLRSGRHLRTLDEPASGPGHPILSRRLRWQQDALGLPYLQSCSGALVRRWAFGAALDAARDAEVDAEVVE